MTCTDCRAEGADCLTADRVRVCSDCLYERVVKERDEARAEADAAYQRGAEAMREAAAGEVFSFYAWSKDNEATRTDIKNLAELIDELSVPEDK